MTSPQLIDAGVSAFTTRGLSTAGEADAFFSEFGVGNTTESPHSPYERFTHYRDLLARLLNADPEKFSRIHKGTPLYFLSWLAFDLHQFEAALHHLDAAIEEDKRRGGNWFNCPGAQFVLLNADGGAAARTVEVLRQRVAGELSRFSAATGVNISTEDFLRRFAEPSLRNGQFALVAAFYAFLLEFDDRVTEIRLRSSPILGSYQPLYLHLFKGGLLLETILKQALPGCSAIARPTLGKIFQSASFEQTIGFKPSSIDIVPVQQLCIEAQVETTAAAFLATGRIRNTMGHNLIVESLPNLPGDYIRLADQEVNAFLFALMKLYP